MLAAYRQAAAARAALGIPPLPLTAQETAALVELLISPPADEDPAFLLDLLTNRVPPGVDDASRVKASFLAAVAEGSVHSPLLTRERAAELLGTMQGGYNVKSLIDLLDDATLAPIAAQGLKHTLLLPIYLPEDIAHPSLIRSPPPARQSRKFSPGPRNTRDKPCPLSATSSRRATSSPPSAASPASAPNTAAPTTATACCAISPPSPPTNCWCRNYSA